MSKEEKILLGLAIVGLAAVILLQRPKNVIAVPNPTSDPVTEIGVSLTPANNSVVSGPAYMTYNSPWLFAPPIGNFLPSITAGIGSQTVNSPTNFAGDDSCGCS